MKTVRPAKGGITILMAVVVMMPVLWLYGPSGVGKTAVGWELFAQLTREGIPAGYVDTDQLGMCYAAPTPENWAPEPVSDPGRFLMKTRNLDAVVRNFRAAGARCVVVSGVVDVDRGVDVDLLPHAAITMCRLRAEPQELIRRVTERGRPSDLVENVLRDAEALDRNNLPGVCVDTTRRRVADVAALARKQIGQWPIVFDQNEQESASFGDPVALAGKALWLCGATAVGKSAVAWHIYQQVRRAGLRAAFVDLDQIGFHRPVPHHDPRQHRLKAANLAAIWRTYHANGAQCLIMTGPLDDPDVIQTYTTALPKVRFTLCRLHANRGQLTERVMRRGDGGPPWGLADDELAGKAVELLQQIAQQAATHAQTLETAGIGDIRVDTDGRSAPDIADDILRQTAWPD